MRKIFNWQVVLGLILITLSAAVYLIQYLIFHDAHHMFMFLLEDLGFVFLEVLLVTLVIHRLLHYREKMSLLHKLNMVVGAFFSEVGTELLRDFSVFDKNAAQVTKKLTIKNNWTEKEFLKVCKSVKGHKYDVDSKKGDLEKIRNFLKERRQFLLGLLENPNLLEHESFTDLLWAVFHLTEELVFRKSLKGLPESDYRHLSGDIERVYQRLISEWINYMRHLQKHYPYLFSLALRTNPFDPGAVVEVS